MRRIDWKTDCKGCLFTFGEGRFDKAINGLNLSEKT